MENLNYRFYILMVLGPMLAICSIRSLRYLSPCSVVANAVSLTLFTARLLHLYQKFLALFQPRMSQNKDGAFHADFSKF